MRRIAFAVVAAALVGAVADYAATLTDVTQEQQATASIMSGRARQGI